MKIPESGTRVSVAIQGWRGPLEGYFVTGFDLNPGLYLGVWDHKRAWAYIYGGSGEDFREEWAYIRSLPGTKEGQNDYLKYIYAGHAQRDEVYLDDIESLVVLEPVHHKPTRRRGRRHRNRIERKAWPI